MTDAYGTTPLPPAATVWYDPTVASGTPQQPQTTPIAHFESAPNDDCPTGALIDVNTNFVVYAVKNGLVRVLDRRSTLRTLLRGHEKKVTDVSFFENGDILGTIGGNLLVWRIFTRESELTAEKLLEIPSDLPDMTRLMWHPFIANQFWLIHNDVNDKRVATLVETTRIKAVPHETETHAVCQLDGEDVVMEGALRLETEASDDGINDLCWSGRDPRHVLTAHEDGAIRLWDVKQAGVTVSNGTSSRMCLTSLQQEEAVTRCFFLPHDNVVGGQSSNITSPFVTATNKNARITLWSPFGENCESPTKLSVFGMENPSMDGYNLAPCFGGTPLRDGPPASFLLLSDRSEGKLFCVAMKSMWTPDEPKRAVLQGWDYVVPFGVMHPIYSWAIIGAPAVSLEEDDEEAAKTGPLFDMHLYSVQSKAVQLLTLAHAMCVPPEASWDKSNPADGVRAESLVQAPVTMVDVTTSGQQFEEDYELKVDELQFEEYNDDVLQEASDQVPTKLEAPVTKSDSGNPFANWLGAIASKTSSSPKPDSKDLAESAEKLPPPVPPSTPNVQTRTLPPGLVNAPPLPGMDVPPPAGPAFLSPVELLQAGQAVSDMETAASALPKNTPANKTEKKKKSDRKKSRSRSPKPQKASKYNGGKKTAQHPMPIPSADGKIAILKREDAVQPPAAESSDDILPPPPQLSNSSDLEEVMKRALAVHFKKHEQMVTSEIQRTVRAEVQNTVLPALSKSLTQSLEQMVVKPLQSAIHKASKESTKVRTDEVVGAISGSIETPLKEAFHESMKTAMIPAYEAATRQMFAQVSSSLEQGLSSQSLVANDSSSKSMAEMSVKLDSISQAMSVLSAEVSQLRSASSAAGGPGGMFDSVGTPPIQPQIDIAQAAREEILTLLSQRSYEAAFTKALSTLSGTTADMAVFCCRNADLNDVLGGSSPVLSQPILLCLMQQLGAALVSAEASDLQTELAWLQEIALVLDPNTESIQRHVAAVLQQLVANINTKMARGDPALRRPLQMLLQVIRGMQ